MISDNERRFVDYLNSSFMPFCKFLIKKNKVSYLVNIVRLLFNNPLVSGRRTAFVYKCELAFSILILFCAFAELIFYDCFVIFFLMIIASFVFVLLYLEFYFGSVYNCPALLHLHTLSAAFMSMVCWLSVLIPIFFGESIYIASRYVA